MARHSLPLTRLIHENLSIVMTFAFSRRPLEEMVDKTFLGEWKHLRKAVFTLSEERVEKACLELALYMRMLDDEQRISEYLKKTSNPSFGRLISTNKSEKPLSLRDVANKIIHCSKFEWEYPGDMTKSMRIGIVDLGPILVCHGNGTEKWARAEIEIIAFAAAVGNLAS
jgi:hypothetical protein